jgi:hypothetical protein
MPKRKRVYAKNKHKPLFLLAAPARFERTTYRLGGGSLLIFFERDRTEIT